MIEISREQLSRRYESMPQDLREALFSAESDELIWTIGDLHHLSDDKKSELARVVGDVIMGFIHIDDMANQITLDLMIDARLAKTLAQEITTKVLNPVLEEIKENYQPPMAMTDIIKPEFFEAPEIEIGPTVGFSPELKDGETGEKFAELKEKIQKGIAQEEELTTSEVLQPKSQPIFGTSEVGNMEQAPAIIHKETELSSASSGARKTLGGIFGFLKKQPEEKPGQSAVVAEVQIGQEQKEQKKETEPREKELPVEKSVTPSLEQSIPERIVHYSGFRTPIEPMTILPKTEAKKEIKDVSENISAPKPVLEEKQVEIKKDESKDEKVVLPETLPVQELKEAKEPKVVNFLEDSVESLPKQAEKIQAEINQKQASPEIKTKESDIISVNSFKPDQTVPAKSELISDENDGKKAEKIENIGQVFVPISQEQKASPPQPDKIGVETKKEEMKKEINPENIGLKDIPVADEGMIDLRKITNE